MHKEGTMTIQTIRRIALCLSLLTTSIAGGATVKHMPQAVNRSPFRYVIVFNEVIDDSGNPPKDAYRYVEVLLDEKAFSEETLKELFKLLSKRFPKPNAMHVEVSTNLEQVDTPEERQAGKMSEAPGNPALDRYPSALLIRQGGNELFRYTPTAPNTDMKTVVLKGRDPQSPQK